MLDHEIAKPRLPVDRPADNLFGRHEAEAKKEVDIFGEIDTGNIGPSDSAEGQGLSVRKRRYQDAGGRGTDRSGRW